MMAKGRYGCSVIADRFAMENAGPLWEGCVRPNRDRRIVDNFVDAFIGDDKQATMVGNGKRDETLCNVWERYR